MSETRNHLCPCGSGKRMKLCCRTPQRATKLALETTAHRLTAEGRHQEACEAFEKRLALSPDNPLIWNDLGNEYAAAGQLEKAITALQRARTIDPDYPLPLYNLGVHTLARCEQLQNSGPADAVQIQELASSAIRYFLDFLAREPNHAACHQSLAAAYRTTDDTERANAHIFEALRLNPTLELPAKGLPVKPMRFLSE